MAQRTNWRFQFAASDVATAARAKYAYHKSREDHWETESARLDKEITDTARVEEMPVTGGTQRVLRYDEGLQKEMNIAAQKHTSHKSSRQVYERWMHLLEGEKGERMLELDSEDAEFFGLHTTA